MLPIAQIGLKISMTKNKKYSQKYLCKLEKLPTFTRDTKLVDGMRLYTLDKSHRSLFLLASEQITKVENDWKIRSLESYGEGDFITTDELYDIELQFANGNGPLHVTYDLGY